MRIVRTVQAALALAVLALTAGTASAQVFGKNKVQYEALDWAVLETPHLRLHYYAEEEALARQLTAHAESVCVEFDARFRLQFRKPIPFLFYSVHHLFQQTNAASGLISEGTGGLTELIKGRVMLPHTGSWSRLVWVTRHELAHAYMLEKIGQVMRAHRRNQGYLPPLWFTEGLAEFCGTEWNAEAEGLLRDAVVSGVARPLTRSDAITGTVLMYKEGHSFLLFLAERYGREKVFDLLDQWYRADDFETLFRIVFGVRLEVLDEEWFDSLRERYYPTVGTTTTPKQVARRLTERSDYNLGPRVMPAQAPGDTTVRFCYIAASAAAIDLMINEPKGDGRRDIRVLRGGQSPAFESFHLFQSRPDVSPSGKIVLSSKRGGRDGLYVVDGNRRRIVRKLDFPRLVAINDPVFVPGDTAVVFSAQDYSGRSDLYRTRWERDHVHLERLTNDDYDDREPDVSPDGRWVVFASDRGQRGGRYALFRMSLETGTVERVSDPASGDDRQPVYSPDGAWIAYRSTRGGTSDLWVRTAGPSREARRVTSLMGPASDPDWLPDGRGLLFTAQEAVTFHTYMMPFSPDTLDVEYETPGDDERLLPTVAYEEDALEYERKLSLDLAQNAVSIDPGLGAPAAGGQVALSDVLGNEQIYIFLSNDSERFGNFWDGFEAGLTYINRARRLNWGLGAFRLTQIYDVDLDQIRRERRVGLLGLVSYPFNKFTRVESSVLVRHASDHRLRNGSSASVDLVTNVLALVHDNTRWTALGPSSGARHYLAAGFTRDLTAGEGDFNSITAETRHYALPLPHLALAARVQAQSSHGRDAQRFYLGGWYSIRGYGRRGLVGEKSVMTQFEARFPLLRGLTLAVPTLWAFPTVSAALYADGAWVWLDGEMTRGGSLGAGFYIGGGYYPALRWNYSWITEDFKTFSTMPRTQFSLGYNF